ncbi:MAG: universal stress protein [Alphaproteobacteria bacterium]
MSIRNILAIVSVTEGDDPALEAAEALARHHGAFLTVLVVAWAPGVPLFADAWIVDPEWKVTIEGAAKKLELDRSGIAERIIRNLGEGAALAFLVDADSPRMEIAALARCTDLTVISRPRKRVIGDALTPLIEAALFQAGKPVMIIPPFWKPQQIGRKVAIAWTSRREAARAVSDALPFLETAEMVSAITIEKKAKLGEPRSGLDLQAHLARHAVDLRLTNLPSSDRPEATVILEEAAAMDADLLVMGAYGHSRFEEFALGGTTREILSYATIPVLMSH